MPFTFAFSPPLPATYFAIADAIIFTLLISLAAASSHYASFDAAADTLF